MKRLLIVCITLLIATASSLAAEVDIKLNKKDEAGTRSISTEPTASHDNNRIYVYSNITQSIEITVKDLSENIIYSNIAIIVAGQRFSFILNNVEKEEYKIELSYDKYFSIGFFSIL
ncbi:DUF3244 domain-containing protein [uncultured Bacteroides sp.]|uniref:DUF3244 domain-containing protein n=1 Tax=uncultured Bacteroides sp. TaxID=162156 RepID=UPI002AA90572|nr:DUF3244 domain-containing protein [uncultured Bacteroides sp.]